MIILLDLLGEYHDWTKICFRLTSLLTLFLFVILKKEENTTYLRPTRFQVVQLRQLRVGPHWR